MATRPDNYLQLHSQATSWGAWHYHRQIALDDTDASFYEISYDQTWNNNVTPSSAGIELRYDSVNDKTIWDVNSTKNTGQTNSSRPEFITMVAGPNASAGSMGSSGTISVDATTDVGKDIVLWGSNSGVYAVTGRHTLTAGSFFTSTSSGGGNPINPQSTGSTTKKVFHNFW